MRGYFERMCLKPSDLGGLSVFESIKETGEQRRSLLLIICLKK